MSLFLIKNVWLFFKSVKKKNSLESPINFNVSVTFVMFCIWLDSMFATYLYSILL